MDVSDIYFFFCSGAGKGESEAPGGGGGGIFTLKIPGGGVSRAGGGRGVRGREGVYGKFGGGGQIFFFGAEIPTEILRAEKTMTATDVTGFDAFFSTGFFATFSRF